MAAVKGPLRRSGRLKTVRQTRRPTLAGRRRKPRPSSAWNQIERIVLEPLPAAFWMKSSAVGCGCAVLGRILLIPLLFYSRPDPPELVALSAVPSGTATDSVQTIVYPDPLLSADEERLFREISPGVRIQTLSNWLEDRR